jgi:hypothetical protein
MPGTSIASSRGQRLRAWRFVSASWPVDVPMPAGNGLLGAEVSMKLKLELASSSRWGIGRYTGANKAQGSSL